MLETAPALPLVFFPGAGGKVEYLKPIAERLARRREARVCAYPGLGGALPDPGLRSLADLQRYLLATLPEQFDLVSMSMGGVLALRIALEHPERIRKLVLMATSGGIDVTSLGALDWRDNFRRLEPERPGWFVEDRTDVTQELGRIRQPTLLIFGDADLIAPPTIGQLLLERLPRARLEIIPQATHDLEIEYPDLIASMIESHLRQPA
jgi:pimeloyl-ACP methyl ester carboxylesterase